jgi:nicotinamidase-related amidase
MRNSLKIAIAALALLATLPAQAAFAAPTTLRNIAGVVPRPAVDPHNAVLIIIDAQNEYRSGKLPLENIDAAIQEIVRLRSWARANGIPVINVQHVGRPTSPLFAKGSDADAIVSELTPAPGEPVVQKTMPNSFAKTNLDDVLTPLNRKQLIVTGFMTHMCVDATTRAATERGYQVFIPASATADRAVPAPDGSVVSAQELKRASLTALNDTFAWVVPSVDDLMAAHK